MTSCFVAPPLCGPASPLTLKSPRPRAVRSAAEGSEFWVPVSGLGDCYLSFQPWLEHWRILLCLETSSAKLHTLKPELKPSSPHRELPRALAKIVMCKCMCVYT